METTARRQFDWGILVALLLPLIAALPTLGDGIAAGADVAVHVHRVHAMSLALAEGNLWPRWISYLHLGYGYPIFNFYAPGATYITALLELTGLHITTAYNLVQTLAWSLGSLGMYLLSRRFLPIPAALLAAALWAYAPSRIYEVWWQGSLAQIVAAAVIPWYFLSIIATAKQPTMRGMAAIALTFAALILTHTPMMYISALFAAPLAFVLSIGYAKSNGREILRRWLMIGGGMLLSAGLAAIFLLPTLLELRHVLISGGIDETYNYLVAQFLPLGEVFAWPRLLDRTDLYLDLPRTLGLAGGILSLLGIVGLIRRRRYSMALLLAIGLGFLVFMLLRPSLPLWLAIPGFANLRFPARLLRVGAILVGMLGGASLLLLPKKWQFAGMLAGMLLVIAQVLPITKPYDAWLNWENISALDEIRHEESARTWGTVSYNEFNPVWGDRIFLDVPTDPERYIEEPFHLRVFGRDIAALNWQGLSYENISANTLRVTTDEDRAVRFRQYYFPGWQATVNGQPADITPDAQIGLITLDLPAGEHLVTLEYVGTPTQHVAALISLVSVIVTLGLLRLGKPQPTPNHEGKLSPLLASGLMAGIVLLALANQYVLQPNGWLQIQSPPTAPHYMETPIGARFENGLTLLGYTLHENTIRPGEPLQLHLYWYTPEMLENNYQPIVQFVNWTQTSAWAVSAPLQPSAGEFSTFSPDRFARDIHLLELSSDEPPPYVGRITVQLRGEDGILHLEDGSERLTLDAVIRIDTSEDRAAEVLDVRFGDVMQLNCASITPVNDQYNIDLHWQTIGTTDRELVVMVHGLDANGDIVTQGDGAPFDENYPSPLWIAGQHLHEVRTLPASPEITQIAIGLYTRDTIERLPATQNTQALPDNRILLPLEENSCSP